MLKTKKMTWEEFEELRIANSFRKEEYEPLCAAELHYVNTETRVDSMLRHRAGESVDTFEILSANMFRRLYETFEELRERHNKPEEDVLDWIYDMYHMVLDLEDFNWKYKKQVSELIVERYNDEWGTYWVAKEDEGEADGRREE